MAVEHLGHFDPSGGQSGQALGSLLDLPVTNVPFPWVKGWALHQTAMLGGILRGWGEITQCSDV